MDTMLLQGPVQPKPPSFFEQAYQGKEDYRKLGTYPYILTIIT